MSAEPSCPACETRVIPWLLAYNEAWHGPKAEWPDSVLDRFYEDAALLHLFTANHKFSSDGKESTERSTVPG